MSDYWSLTNPVIIFKENEKVKTRGDFGHFNLKIIKIHNTHYCKCRQLLFNFIPFGKLRHFNMNVLEKQELNK
jgi:hypothetical protein